jgi:hypothetical protein
MALKSVKKVVWPFAVVEVPGINPSVTARIKKSISTVKCRTIFFEGKQAEKSLIREEFHADHYPLYVGFN